MSNKNDKKIRQLHRKQFRKEIAPLIKERVDMMAAHVLNARPKWLPKFVWNRLVKFVLKV